VSEKIGDFLPRPTVEVANDVSRRGCSFRCNTPSVAFGAVGVYADPRKTGEQSVEDVPEGAHAQVHP
jgi:hypothetical protein